MSWELFLYPEILTPTWTIRWRWTFLWIGLSVVGMWWLMSRKSTPNPSFINEGGTQETPISMDVYRERISQLQQTIWQTDTQSRYREYQQILRDVVYTVYGMDISSTTLQSLTYAHTGLQTSVVDLLRQTYYYPYNLETGDQWVMLDESTQLLSLLSDGSDKSIKKSTKK